MGCRTDEEIRAEIKLHQDFMQTAAYNNYTKPIEKIAIKNLTENLKADLVQREQVGFSEFYRGLCALPLLRKEHVKHIKAWLKRFENTEIATYAQRGINEFKKGSGVIANKYLNVYSRVLQALEDRNVDKLGYFAQTDKLSGKDKQVKEISIDDLDKLPDWVNSKDEPAQEDFS